MRNKGRMKPKKVSISLLNPRKTDDVEYVPQWKVKGSRFGLGLTAFLRQLFEINEKLPAHNKMTNAELERQVLTECGHVESTALSFQSRRMTVNKYRHKHNTGKLIVPYYTPLPLSFRYNLQGQAVDYRTGKRKLTPQDISEIIEKYYVHQVEHTDMDPEEFREHMYLVHEQHFNIELPRMEQWQPGKTSSDE